MFSLIVDCPECNARFNLEQSASELSGAITCPECGKERAFEDYCAVIFCNQCRAKLKIPLDMLEDSDLCCPKCSALISTWSKNEAVEDDEETFFDDGLAEKRQLLQPGDIFDKFQIKSFLGRGGMAEVYSAEHLLLKKTYALKLMRNENSNSDNVFVKRFLREAKMTHALEHPNIVRVLDAGSDFQTGYLFIAMELVEGLTLQQSLQKNQLSEEELRKILFVMANALSALERAGIVHRDIKPSNIMCTADGVYKLMDLGIAKLQRPEAGENTLTMEKSVIGTPAYASPEQCQSSHNVDIRSDIYSLGATMYHAATGRLPFDGKTAIDTVLKVLKDKPVPLKELRPDLSDELVFVIEKMMEKSPADRPQTPHEVIEMLQFGNAVGKKKRFAGRKFPLKKVAWAGAAAAVIAVVLCMIGGGESKNVQPSAKMNTAKVAQAVPGKQPAAPKAVKKIPVIKESTLDPGDMKKITAFRKSFNSSDKNLQSVYAVKDYQKRTPVFRLAECEKRLEFLQKQPENELIVKQKEYTAKQIAALKKFIADRKVIEQAKKKKYDQKTTELYKRKVVEYSKKFMIPQFYPAVKKAGKELAALLKTGRVDPNVEIVLEHKDKYLPEKIVSWDLVQTGRFYPDVNKNIKNDFYEALKKCHADPDLGHGVVLKKYYPTILELSNVDCLGDPAKNADPPVKLFTDCKVWQSRYPVGDSYDTGLLRKLLLLAPDTERVIDSDGNNLLHFASRINDLELAEALIYSGADLAKKLNKAGKSPWQTALSCGSVETAELLRKYNLNTESQPEELIQYEFCKNILLKNYDKCKKLLAAGADPYKNWFNGLNTMQNIAAAGDLSGVKFLLEQKISPDNVSMRYNCYISSPQEIAIVKNNPELLKSLLENGADPQIKVHYFLNGAAPLGCVITSLLTDGKLDHRSALKLMETLCQYGKNFDINKEINGNRILHCFISESYRIRDKDVKAAFLKLLLKYGAIPYKQYNQFLSDREKDPECVRLLKAAEKKYDEVISKVN